MTDAEVSALIRGVASGEIAADFVDWDQFDKPKQREIVTLILYEMRRLQWEKVEEEQAPAQARALGLLRTLLTPAQLVRLRKTGWFYVTGSAGGVYRLRPETGAVLAVTRHGSRFYAHTRLCFHDPEGVMPYADITLGQMLHLRTDEPAFLAEAIPTPLNSSLWDGAWLRTLRANRRARELTRAAS